MRYAVQEIKKYRAEVGAAFCMCCCLMVFFSGRRSFREIRFAFDGSNNGNREIGLLLGIIFRQKEHKQSGEKKAQQFFEELRRRARTGAVDARERESISLLLRWGRIESRLRKTPTFNSTNIPLGIRFSRAFLMGKSIAVPFGESMAGRLAKNFAYRLFRLRHVAYREEPKGMFEEFRQMLVKRA